MAAEAEVWAGRDTVEEVLGRDLEWAVAEVLAEAEVLAGEAPAGPGRASEVVPVLGGLAHPLCGNQAEVLAEAEVLAGEALAPAEREPVAEVELERAVADLAVEVVLEVEPEQVVAPAEAGLEAVPVRAQESAVAPSVMAARLLENG